MGTKGIPTDSWVIMESEDKPGELYIIRDIQKKEERLAPVRGRDGKVHLKNVPNPKEMVKKPALSDEQLLSIFENAKRTEALFGDPATDIEGICKPNMVHFVQARTRQTPRLDASYFDTTDLNEDQRRAILGSAPTIPLVSGRSNVVEITQSEQLLVAQTLEEALKLYDNTLHRVVVVSQPSPPLSHAVVNFSLLGVPCFLNLPNTAISTLREGITRDRPVELCTQTATFYHWDKNIADPQVCLKPGFGRHPARITPSPLSRSVRVGKAPPAPPEIRRLLMSLRAAPTHQAGLSVLNTLQEQAAVRQVGELARKQRQAAQAQPQIPFKAQKIIGALSEYDEAITRAFAEARAVFSRTESRPGGDRLERLFHAEILEAALLEPFYEIPGGVGRCHVMQVPLMSSAATALLNYQQQLSAPAKFADLLLPSNTVSFGDWRQFLLNLEEEAQKGKITADEVGQFNTAIKSLRKSGALPFWFTFYVKGDSEVTACRNLLQQFSKKDTPLLDQLHTYQLAITRFNQQMTRFSNPQTFDAAWKELQIMVDLWRSEALLTSIRNALPLTQNIAYQTMERFVTMFDTAIKTMKTGTDSDQDKLPKFKQMIIVYLDLMGAWANNWSSLITPLAWANQIDRYITQLRQVWKNSSTNAEWELSPHPQFNASIAVLERAGLYFQIPQTLEDLFTLIHQNLIVFLSTFTMQLFGDDLTDSRLPKPFKDAIGIVPKAIRSIGISVAEDTCVYHGHYQLGQHSAQLDLIYDKNSPNIGFKVSFTGSGGVTVGRWHDIAAWVRLLKEAQVLLHDGPIISGLNTLAFEWSVKPTDISKAMGEFLNMCEHASSYSEYYALPSPMQESILDSELACKEIPDIVLRRQENIMRHLSPFVTQGDPRAIVLVLAKMRLLLDFPGDKALALFQATSDCGWSVNALAKQNVTNEVQDLIARWREKKV